MKPRIPYTLFSTLLIMATAAVSQAQNYTYITNSGTITITGYTGSADPLIIPETINDLTVTSIGDFAFMGNPTVTNVIITNNVTTIGESAFFDCSELTSIVLPTGITDIANSTFCECRNLTNLFIPNNVMTIGDYAFSGCTELQNVSISTNTWLIGASAFQNCSSLTNIFIPSSVGIIGDNAFQNCSTMEIYEVDDANMDFSSLDGVLLNKDQSTLLIYPAGKHGAYNIPNSVTFIGSGAFSECDYLTSVFIPTGITAIADSTFFGCDALMTVSIPDSVLTVGAGAFGACSSLTEVKMPNSITTLGSGIFQYCGSLTNVVLPNSITSIPDWMFTGTDLISITIPGTVTSIGARAFAYDTGTLKFIYFLGDPPSLHTAYPFYQIHPDAVFYYMDYAQGWGSSFGGFPAVLWNPTIQTANSDFGMNTKGFGFTLPIGPINYTVIIQASTNLVIGAWDSISTNQLSDLSADLFTDETATNYPSRYYRITTP